MKKQRQRKPERRLLYPLIFLIVAAALAITFLNTTDAITTILGAHSLPAAVAAELRILVLIPALTVAVILLLAGSLLLYFENQAVRSKTHSQMEQIAFYDPLTGLENRRLFRDRLEQGLKQVRREPSQMMALLFMDLDQFKRINDTLGHEAGDELLCVVARRLRECLREQDVVARLGGDEFTILLPKLHEGAAAGRVADKLLQAINQPIQLSMQEVRISASIGITLAPEDNLDAGVLMRNADLAMYRAKDLGRNNFQFFTEDMNIRAATRMTREDELREAVNAQAQTETPDNAGDFAVFFQPQVDLLENRICGFEALVRWQHPRLGMLPPGEFIPLAEETGLIIDIGRIVLRQACRQLRLFHQEGQTGQSVTVNLSARQFRDPGLLPLLQQELRETGLEARWLELEISETVLLDDIDRSLITLRQLKALGVTLTLDNFGTGYTSLSLLSRLPVDKIKLDRHFVCNLPEVRTDIAISLTIIAMARKLKLQVLAEGVETEEQLNFLRQNHCHLQQGFLFCAPVAAGELPEHVRQLQNRLLPANDAVFLQSRETH